MKLPKQFPYLCLSNKNKQWFWIPRYILHHFFYEPFWSRSSYVQHNKLFLALARKMMTSLWSFEAACFLDTFFLLHSSFPEHETFRYAFMVSQLNLHRAKNGHHHPLKNSNERFLPKVFFKYQVPYWSPIYVSKYVFRIA